MQRDRPVHPGRCGEASGRARAASGAAESRCVRVAHPLRGLSDERDQVSGLLVRRDQGVPRMHIAWRREQAQAHRQSAPGDSDGECQSQGDAAQGDGPAGVTDHLRQYDARSPRFPTCTRGQWRPIRPQTVTNHTSVSNRGHR